MSAILHSIVVSIENDRISNLIDNWRDESKFKIKYLFNLWKFKIKYFPIFNSMKPCLMCDNYMDMLMDKTWKGLCGYCIDDRRWKCGLCDELYDGDKVKCIYLYNEFSLEEEEVISCKNCIFTY